VSTIDEYTKDDFIASTKPYETVVSIKDPFQKRQEINRMAELAAAVGFRGFKKMLEDYERSQRSNRDNVYIDNVTSFQGQPIELNAGEWEVSETGISRSTGFGDEVACVHPIIPIERYVNVDTGVEKLKIWWRKGKTYRTGIFDRKTLATASGIVALADHGVAVNSESAKTLVRWLHDVENLNYEQIPEKQSVGRLGWIDTDADDMPRFSPYAGSLEFDGDENFRSFFQAVKPSGTFKEWLAMAHEIRKNGITARVVLAASFASVLVQLVGIKPFFVHMWGGAGSGKAQPLDTRIITPDGFKLMGDLHIGDKVIGRDGRPHTVTGVYPQGQKEVFELTFKDGTKTRCCREHLWYIKTLTRKEHGRDFKVASLDEMLSLPLKKDSYNLRVPINAPVEYMSQTEPLPIEPYLLGALIGDGCLTLKKNPANYNVSLYFNNSEADVIKRVSSALSARGMKMRFNPYSTNQFVISGEGKPKLRDDIISLGLNVYSRDRFIPDAYKTASVQDRRLLLAGLFDTDGSVSEKGSFSYSTVSRKLADDVATVCRSLGYRATISVSARAEKSDCYQVRIPTHDCIFKSDKHNSRTDAAIASRGNGNPQYYDDLPIVSIEPVGAIECQCIMVDSDDHTYLCDDFIVTHNTVGLMLAASVWANPEIGRYIHTFNSTSVGQEMSASFVNSLPLIMDELQVVKNKSDFDETIYKLAEGVGRTRSNKGLGLSRSYTWANCIITTGEMPITTGSSGGGAVDRVVNIECKEALFANPRLIAQFTRKHYGHAGKRFVAALIKHGFGRVTEFHNKFTREIEKTDATPRQSLAAALILTADALANEYLYNDGNSLTVPDMIEFLASKSAVDVNGRGYQYMCEWVAQNAHRLTKDSNDGKECWGELKDDVAYVVRSRFNDAAESAGYNATALLSWCKQKTLIEINKAAYTVSRRINKVQSECVALKLPSDDGQAEFEELPENEEMPF